jgi:hypothetical protein
MHDLDIWCAAIEMMKHFGAKAAGKAAFRAGELLEAGDEDGVAAWAAILWAICELQREHPRKGEPVQ